jgi:hypothetical protein
MLSFCAGAVVGLNVTARMENRQSRVRQIKTGGGMNKQLLTVLAMAVAIGLVGVPALAQKAVVKIPFSFVAGDRELPAGTYSIRPEMETQNRLTIRNQDTGDSIMVPVITRLADKGAKELELVFDKAGDKSYLSEVYIPGVDGYHLKGAPGQHTHVKVMVSK